MTTQFLRMTATKPCGTITEKILPVYDRVGREASLAMNAHETFVPEVLRESLIGHIDTGAPVGSFLRAVLDNDLQGAVREAQTVSPHHIVSILRWLWEYAPMEAWGTADKRIGWSDARHRDAQKKEVA